MFQYCVKNEDKISQNDINSKLLRNLYNFFIYPELVEKTLYFLLFLVALNFISIKYIKKDINIEMNLNY